MAKHTTETLNFNSFSGYYASVSPGYGGFNWSDIDFMNATFWQNEMTNWCDTGYQNVIHGPGEAVTWGTNGSTSVALFVSADSYTSFTLKSMIAASAWETDQPFTFYTYHYVKKHGLQLKATDTIYLSQTPQTLDFAKIGHHGDFANIAAVEIVSGSGQYGNTCTYGPYGYTTGNEMAFDNMKVKWNGKIPKGNNSSVSPGHQSHNHSQLHAVTAHVTYGPHHGAHDNGHDDAGAHSQTQADSHSPSSIDSSHLGALTHQMPPVEHFGT
ncbi:MAG TPA: hypothetical protein VHU23_18790 [Rhizomicrobium sp.]|jgi:hypothetical protein|nr:hypothetical protein [Rhizomicrobium sp.]